VAPLMGYSVLLDAADACLALVDAVADDTLSLTPEQLRMALSIAADAAEVMSKPRIQEEVSLSSEDFFLHSFRAVVGKAARLMVHDAPGITRLVDSFARLERSGVLQRRDIDVGCSVNNGVGEDAARAAAAASTAPGLRVCAFASCGACEQHPNHFKSCAACRIPTYCCKEHQTEDWPSHKKACKAARKAAAEEHAS
jgi:hypothetical protein